MNKKVINELYIAVQGEGKYDGIPTIVVRFVGCTHRCWFGESGGWCDSWMNSISPEKANLSIQDVIDFAIKNNNIKHMMITGGSPTLHQEQLKILSEFTRNTDLFTTLETEGSFELEEGVWFDFISLSPKFSNSIPKLGIKKPNGEIVTEKDIDQHNKFRGNIEVMKKLIQQGGDYQLKPVWDGENELVLEEILQLSKELEIPKEKIYFMPAGDSRGKLIKTYPKVMNFCVRNNYNFTGRPHIIAYNKERYV